jgi:hypothetical protein
MYKCNLTSIFYWIYAYYIYLFVYAIFYLSIYTSLIFNFSYQYTHKYMNMFLLFYISNSSKCSTKRNIYLNLLQIIVCNSFVIKTPELKLVRSYNSCWIGISIWIPVPNFNPVIQRRWVVVVIVKFLILNLLGVSSNLPF